MSIQLNPRFEIPPSTFDVLGMAIVLLNSLIPNYQNELYEIFTLKFTYSEKPTKFCEIFTLLLSYVVPVKSEVKISQNFVGFSEYVNFKVKIS